VQPVSANATIASESTPATGTVTFTDKLGSATVTSTQPLNAAGLAEWSTGVFAPGSHTVSESYSGDPSYNPSTAAAAASFTVIPGSTSLTVKPLATSVTAGASVTVDVTLTTGYLSLYGVLPTGNVTVTLAGQVATAAWQPFGTTGNASLEAVVTFNNVPAGILPLIAYYTGDSNWLGSAANGGTIIALASKLTPTVALTSSSANPAPGQSFTLTASAIGPAGKPTPTGTVAFLSDGQSFDTFATLNKGKATLTIPGYSAANGTNIFTAVYQGDANYNSAASNAVNVTIAQSDFSLTTQNAELAISPSGSGTATLSLAPINGFSGTVTLTTSAPASITATPATASLALSAPATDVLNLKVAASMAPGIYPLTITASGGGHVHTAQILVKVLAVAAPVFSPAAGSYTTSQQVTLTDATPGTTLYYTTNGAIPTASSTKYTGAISVSATETIQAIAVASGYAPSSVASAAYTIVSSASNGCPTGSGSCVDQFTGASGTTLSSYNSQWVLAGGTGAIYTTGSDSAEIAGTSTAVYYYTGSSSETSQITAAPSSATIGYEKLACVRVSAGIPGYCVGFSAVSSGNYTACYVMKDFKYLGGGNCGTVSATASHTLGLTASGTSTVTLSVYLDGVLKGTVTDSSSPHTVAGSGFGLQGDGTPADSAVNEWQDHNGTPPTNKCPTGSGSCVDQFTGASGTTLSSYNSQWVLAGGTGAIYTTGSDSAEIAGTSTAVYYYTGSSSETSQITAAPSSTTIGYEKLACVRVSAGIPGYCVGFSAASNGNYTACYVMKDFKYLGGGNCGTVSATASHTLGLTASGTSTVTLSVYLDGVLKGTVTDSSSPHTVAGSGFGLQGDGTPANSAVNEWQDYNGSSPASTTSSRPATGTYSPVQAVTMNPRIPTAKID
jgi:hypothetical protein